TLQIFTLAYPRQLFSSYCLAMLLIILIGN
ncbi:MAG: hypothetical protein ACI81A_002405, partial [Paraglaciecola sp.]